MPTVERLRLLWNLHQAVRVAHFDARPIELDSDETAEANVAREKMCLKEVSKKYLKIVARWEQLDRLSFEDPQLQEASKTYLYGFYRACIVLCAIAVENQLKRICGSDRPIRELIKSAKECKYITLDLADAAQRLFGIRNDVVHNNDDPLADKAKEMVGVARLLVSEFRNVPSFSK